MSPAKKQKNEKLKKMSTKKPEKIASNEQIVSSKKDVSIDKSTSNGKSASIESVIQKEKSTSNQSKEDTLTTLDASSKNVEDTNEPADSSVYEVDELIDYKKTRNKEWFLIRWKGFSPDSDTWEPIENLRGLEDQVEILRKKYAIKKKQSKK